MKEENKPTTNAKRQELKALSAIIQTTRKQTHDERTINELLLEHYAKEYGTTELKTFDEWKESGYAVKKGATSFTIWGKPISNNNENEPREFFPLKHLFDIKQVHEIKH